MCGEQLAVGRIPKSGSLDCKALRDELVRVSVFRIVICSRLSCVAHRPCVGMAGMDSPQAGIMVAIL